VLSQQAAHVNVVPTMSASFCMRSTCQTICRVMFCVSAVTINILRGHMFLFLSVELSLEVLSVQHQSKCRHKSRYVTCVITRSHATT